MSSQTQYQSLNGSEFVTGGNGGNNGGGNNNGGPVLSNANNAVTYTGTPVTLDSSIILTDTTANVSSVNVWISSTSFQAGDTLSISGPNVTGSATDGTIADADGSTIHYHLDTTTVPNEVQLFLSGISGTPTTADFQAALQMIQFSPGAGDGDRTVTWAAYDNSQYSQTVTTTVHVGPVLNSFTLAVGKGGTTVLTDTDFNVSDPGFTNLPIR